MKEGYRVNRIGERKRKEHVRDFICEYMKPNESECEQCFGVRECVCKCISA